MRFSSLFTIRRRTLVSLLVKNVIKDIIENVDKSAFSITKNRQ